ncbi:putative sulfoacetate transporter SauU [Oxobacter pfennigii]|uniref:Putative sulfoacetate transporter SauU n=1 Tax=Oxobacter pfennigii TaxID=36849 RepID=A0A0P8WP39_9CLOT|nr:MFS transporter [Oxobacter pfennigii]KPU44341.1 putative sulfoacetate transporter SauU [Oxobacter pfennigii]
MSENSRTSKFHKAWLMMAVGCLCMALLTMMGGMASFLIQPITSELGFQRGAFTLYIGIQGIISGFTMPIWGKYLPKIGIKPMVSISSVVCGIAMALYSQCTTLTGFYIIAVFVGGFLPGCTILPASVVVNNWFVKRKGFALGITMGFGSIAAAIMNPIIASITPTLGWQKIYLILGTTILIVGILITLFIQDHPSKAGLSPYGAEEIGSTQTKPQEVLTGVTYKNAIKSIPFWLVTIGIVLGMIGITGVNAHIPAFLSGIGLAASAGFLMSVFSLSGFGARILVGSLNDYFGIRVATIATLTIASIGLVMFTFIKGFPFAAAALIVFSVGVPINTLIPPLMVTEIFGKKYFSEIYSLIGGISNLAFGFAAPFYGFGFDLTGAYTIPMYLGAAMCIATMFLMLTAVKLGSKLRKSDESPEPSANSIG